MTEKITGMEEGVNLYESNNKERIYEWSNLENN